MNEGDPTLPAERPSQPCLLVQSTQAILPMNWVKQLLANLGPTCKLVSHDGAQALITTTAETAKKLDGVLVNGTLMLFDFSLVLKKREEADLAMRRSLERASPASAQRGAQAASARPPL